MFISFFPHSSRCFAFLFALDLIGTLESNHTLVHVELGGNHGIDPVLADEVRAILEPRERDNKQRSSHDIDEVAQIIQQVHANDPTLIELDLSTMNVGLRDDAVAMFDSLAENSYIQRVDLSNNEIDDDCVSSISLALLDNKSITHLNLAHNSITSEGAECK